MSKDTKQSINSQRGSEKSKGGNQPSSKPPAQSSPYGSQKK